MTDSGAGGAASVTRFQAGPIAVTGPGGRLGRAAVQALRDRGVMPLIWQRPEYDLDDPSAAQRLVSRDRPGLVFHCAAWTDVDGCARDPATAQRRNAQAVGELAGACAAIGAAFVLVSTNEVFDGLRTDHRGYTEADAPAPANAYGKSKLAGELAARDAFRAAGQSGPWIIRTSWLYGPPGNDFPAKIVAAADRLPAGSAVRVVDDEFGCPTYTRDLAPALVALVEATPPDIYHLAAPGHASRHELAVAVLDRCRAGTPIERISLRDFERDSPPPAWSVLDSSRAAAYGARLRGWRAALDDYLAGICRAPG